MPKNPNAIPIEDKAAFVGLSGELSPENLTCDGELSPLQVKARRADIDARWRALEAKHGIAVSQARADAWWPEVNDWEDKRAKEEHRRVLALAGDDPRLVPGGTGQWHRKAANSTDMIWDSPYLLYLIEEEAAFHVDCSMAGHFGAERSHGPYQTLAEAADAGDALLRTFTAERLKETRPSWDETVVQRLLNKVPEELREQPGSPAP